LNKAAEYGGIITKPGYEVTAKVYPSRTYS